MRILHTADWHLNDRLERQDRQPDLLRALDQIRNYLDDYQVDVMIVAGDLFSEHSSREQWRSAIHEIKERFLPFMTRGGTIVAISGNHDNDAYFEMLRDALDMAAPGRPTQPGLQATGRLHIRSNPYYLRLADPAGEVVQFVLMPYPKTSNYLHGESLNYTSAAAKHNALQAKFTEVLSELQRTKIDPSLPTVLVSHIHVRGVSAHTPYRISETEDVMFEPSDIPTNYKYVAYGHIHKPGEAIPGAEHIRYSGSIDRMDAAEGDDQKSVVLVEIKDKQRQNLTCLPLNATPIYQVTITDPDTEIESLSARYPDAARALVSYTLHWEAGRHHRDALAQRIETIFPRWYSRTFQEAGVSISSASLYSANHLQDVAGNARRYLETALLNDPHRAEVLALLEELLAEGDKP